MIKQLYKLFVDVYQITSRAFKV